jgi:hypothetical protein
MGWGVKKKVTGQCAHSRNENTPKNISSPEVLVSAARPMFQEAKCRAPGDDGCVIYLNGSIFSSIL